MVNLGFEARIPPLPPIETMGRRGIVRASLLNGATLGNRP